MFFYVHEKTSPYFPEYSPQAWYISLNAGLQVFEFFMLRNAMRAVESSVLKNFSTNNHFSGDVQDFETDNVENVAQQQANEASVGCEQEFYCDETEELLIDM